ncbi:tryptophan--tRNA ligase [Syntrophobacter fumaroxidans]|uniref:Tryptophan--tRNA ligase n=1 Tax=Syntrophobacter fumaroxidans (strain DSM 10017 / MPOB) TaxID=335543 RepID=A0LG29_SYNFM|nr:tryptophan--tRNA ligase [Syntrophobacter fumaroxidans]ABK16381.1 tryptophanyl-tRNA synthetase [Syntrophobacter fumaroxidans MPOB]
MTERKRILSGMRPTGRLHLGNLHGALDNWIQLQQQYECFFFVADWHALTTEYATPGQIRENTWEMVIDWLAAGLDPAQSTLFIQSDIKEHAELHLLLSMITPLPWLERTPTYKEQLQQLDQKDLSTYGFLGYPVLQAADIVIYRAHGVPVGKDQLPHVELTREIARRFNFMYEREVFPIPDALLTEVPVLPGLDGRKMSKSYGNCIFISEPEESVKDKISKMMTDPQRIRRNDPGDPEVCPVFAYHKLYSSPGQVADVARGCRTAGIGCVECKQILMHNVLSRLGPIHERRLKLERETDRVREVVLTGNAAARKEAALTMAEVRKAVGMS